jgi:hypothetical protein
MRYLVRAPIKPGMEQALLAAIEPRTLGRGSVAEGKHLRNMHDARLCPDGTTRWVEVCYYPTPLRGATVLGAYFELAKVQDAHDRRECRDANCSEPWACENCDCTARLEDRLRTSGRPFFEVLWQEGDENHW